MWVTKQLGKGLLDPEVHEQAGMLALQCAAASAYRLCVTAGWNATGLHDMSHMADASAD